MDTHRTFGTSLKTHTHSHTHTHPTTASATSSRPSASSACEVEWTRRVVRRHSKDPKKKTDYVQDDRPQRNHRDARDAQGE